MNLKIRDSETIKVIQGVSDMTFSEIIKRIDISLTFDYASWLDKEFLIDECKEDDEWDYLTEDDKKALFLEVATDLFSGELEKLLNNMGGE